MVGHDIGFAMTLVAILGLLDPGAVVFGQRLMPNGVSPIPAAERFTPGSGLRVHLTVRKPSVAAFEDPGFVVRFENVGKTPIYLNPRVASNVFIYDDSGRLVAPFEFSISESIYLVVQKSQLVRLRPGQSWLQPLYPEHETDDGFEWVAMYTSSERRDTPNLMLRGGTYNARFVYLNSPDYPVHYDPHAIRDIWEGRQESDPVGFSVAPGAEAEIAARARTVRSLESRDYYPQSVAEAESMLASGEQGRVANAIDALRRWHSTASISALLPLLSDTRPWKRRVAAQLIFVLGDERVRELAWSLIDDPDTGVRNDALRWIAKHCTAAELSMIEARLDPTSSDGMLGLVNCGNAATFTKIRPMLDSAASRPQAVWALRRLTFVGYEGTELSMPFRPEDWDVWYRRRGRESREEWAVRQLREHRPAAADAVDYLKRLNDRRLLTLLREAASQENGFVRVAAARGIARFERAEGMALLRRELQNRHPSICSEAVGALNELTDQHLKFDFKIPADRDRAMAAF